MLKNECAHIWETPNGPEKISRDPSNSPMLKCAHCNTLMQSSIVFQIEALENQTKSLDNETKLVKHQMGFQKWLSVLALIVSFIAVLVAWLK